MNEQSVEELMRFLKYANERVSELASNMQFDADNLSHVYPLTLYCSLIELTFGVINLIERDANIGVPILSRAFLEAYVEILNMVADPKYYKVIEHTSDTEWMEILKESETKENSYLEAIANMENFEQVKEDLQSKIDASKDEGINKVLIKDKFIKSGMEKGYRSVYKMWSWHSHNNLNALVERHMDRVEGRISINLFRKKPLIRNVQYILLVCEALIDATIKIHGFLNSPVMEEIDEISRQLQENKRNWMNKI